MQKNQETWIPSLDREDPLKKDMATHSGTLAWRSPWTEKPGGYSPEGCTESDTTEAAERTGMQGLEGSQASPRVNAEEEGAPLKDGSVSH